MKVLAKFAGAAALLVALWGVPLLAQNVHVDYDHNYQFGKLKGYTWGKVEVTDPAVEPRIAAAVDRVLNGYGYHTSDKGTVIVTAVEATSSEQYASFYDGMKNLDWRRGWSGGTFSDTADTLENVAPGTLVIDLYDTATGKLVWRGTAAEGVASSEKKNKDDMDKAVNKMFAKFPPKNKPVTPNQQIPREPATHTSAH